jgi:ketosteroid isomerase-like protein
LLRSQGSLDEALAAMTEGAGLRGTDDPPARAVAIVSVLVGGMTLARAVPDGPLAAEILAAARAGAARLIDAVASTTDHGAPRIDRSDRSSRPHPQEVDVPAISDAASASAVRTAERLPVEFFGRVWAAPHDLDAIDELMTEDYAITSGGTVIRGREAFKRWVAEFQTRLLDATNETLEVFANATGDRVVSRWVCRGRNNGIFDLPPDGREVAFTGIAIWRVENGRLAECWVERAAWEAYRALTR